MKKILVFVLTVIFALSASLSVSAEPGKFISSPSNSQSPELIGYENSDEDCTGKLKITSYANRKTLPDEILEKFEEAYRIIASTRDLSTLNTTLTQIADDLGVDISDLAVSDMFDISVIGCDEHADHGHFDITLRADSLKNFVCLLHYYNGSWRIVDSAKVTNNGTHLDFTEKEFSPFAVVVNTGKGSVDYDDDIADDKDETENDATDKDDAADDNAEDKENSSTDKEDADSPQTGDDSNIALYVVIMAISAAGLFFIWKKSKKNM